MAKRESSKIVRNSIIQDLKAFEGDLCVTWFNYYCSKWGLNLHLETLKQVLHKDKLASILMTLMCVTQVMDYKHMLTLQFYLHFCSQTNNLLGPGGTLLTNSFFVFPVTNIMESFWFNNDGQMHKKTIKLNLSSTVKSW